VTAGRYTITLTTRHGTQRITRQYRYRLSIHLTHPKAPGAQATRPRPAAQPTPRAAAGQGIRGYYRGSGVSI